MSNSGDFQFGGEIVWRPSPEIIAQSNLQRFIDRHRLGTFAELMRRSTTDIEWFWNAVLEDLDVRFYEPYTKIVDLSRGPAFPKWCVGGRLNIVHNLLDKHTGTSTDSKIALRYESEEGNLQTFTYAQLRDEVNRCANHLRSLGLGKGDAIGVFLPMNAACVVSVLAIAKIGAILLPLFSGYGPDAIISRLIDAEAKAMICADSGMRRGQPVLMRPVAEQAAAGIPSLRHLILVPRTGPAPWANEKNSADTEKTSAEDPLMIIYTSGTTGKPKGTVHTHCGFPIKAAQDMAHGLDVHPDETVFWLTDIGWMMGPWLIFGTLLLGATMVVFDGAPDFPGPDRLWSLAAKHKVTSLGVSPTLIRALLRHGEEPVRRHDLSSLRKFASSGEPWNPDPWLWLFQVVGGGRLPIINYSGGTEISGGIVMSHVFAPMKPCCFSGPLPGMAADVVDDSGRPVRGEVGELIIRQPWIGMTRGFWKDEQRYLDTYWSRLPGVWVHGDWAAIDNDGLWYILGRSDDTIKVAGKRLGPAEVESILVAHPAVGEAAAIGVPDELKGDALVCFCVLKSGHTPSEGLREELKQRIVSSLGKPLKPKDLKFVRDIPKTRNAKIMRRVVRALYLGQELKDTSSLDNRASLEDIRQAV